MGSNDIYERILDLEKQQDNLLNQKSIIEDKIYKLAIEIKELKSKRLSVNKNETSLDRPQTVSPKLPSYFSISTTIQSLCINNRCSIPELYGIHGAWVGTTCEYLAQIGREIVVYKTSIPYDENKRKQMEDLVKTCFEVSTRFGRGDVNGYTKYLLFLKKEFGIPSNPFLGPEDPYDFFFEKEDLIFQNVYYLKYFLRYFQKKNCFEVLTTEEKLFNLDIDISFAYLLNDLHTLLRHGYTIGIIPIFNSRIIERSKQTAQDENGFMSLLYDRYYVDSPKLQPSNKYDNNLNSMSQSSDIKYITSHFRRGHIRNGIWINGGYVHGYFKK